MSTKLNSQDEKELGKIVDTMLGFEDHGIFTFVLFFDFGGHCQGFGTFCLSSYDKKKEKMIGTRFGCEAIMRVLQAVGVDKWEDLKGEEMWVYRRDGLIKKIEAPKYREYCVAFDIEELAEERKGDF